MTLSATKRSVMTLFSGSDDLRSHQVRIVLAEKGVNVDICQVNPKHLPDELSELNPYSSVPTLVDRELILYEANIIMEYLNERFPHPPLMSVYPMTRANSRLTMLRIERDWYRLVDMILTGHEDANKVKQQLREDLLAMAPIFAENEFFMSDEFTLTDCYLIPLLWRLPLLGIDLVGKGSKEIKAYMIRMFERPSVQASLTEQERRIRAIG